MVGTLYDVVVVSVLIELNTLQNINIRMVTCAYNININNINMHEIVSRHCYFLRLQATTKETVLLVDCCLLTDCTSLAAIRSPPDANGLLFVKNSTLPNRLEKIFFKTCIANILIVSTPLRFFFSFTKRIHIFITSATDYTV